MLPKQTDQTYICGMSKDLSSKHRAALFSVFASAALVVGKGVVAVLTGSLAVLSEALHSLIDFAATILTLLAVRWADQPADEDHHYGHAKIESVAALFESFLLGVTAVYVAYAAVERLWRGEEPAHVEWWAPAVVLAAIVVDYNRVRALRKAAAEAQSEALAADSAHFESDMYGSFAVLIGLTGVWLGFPLADSIAALVVSGFVAWIGYKLGRDTLSTLLDRAPEGLAHSIRVAVEREPGILGVSELRLRRAGPTTYVSLTGTVPRSLAVNQLPVLRERIGAKISRLVPSPDLSLVLEPVALDTETANEKAQAIAAERGLHIHHLLVQNIGGRLAVSFDVEVERSATLLAAHEEATALEDAIRAGLGGDVEVESHIEPRPENEVEGTPAPAAVTSKVTRALSTLAKGEKTLHDVHNVRVRSVDGAIYMHYHCRFSPDMRIDDVHAVLDRVEAGLIDRFPDIKRVVAHAEPIGHARHRL